MIGLDAAANLGETATSDSRRKDMPRDKSKKHQAVPLLALLLAWIIPGTGHIYMGRIKRGIVIMVTIAATFWAGVAVGGVMTVDRHEERWWFVAQMFTGVHGLVGWQRQEAVQKKLEEYLNENLPGDKASNDPLRNAYADRWLQDEYDKGRVALVGSSGIFARAYTGIAGLLNLMCIFDAAMLALMGIYGEQKPEEYDTKKKANQT